jgi:hypothetical protein
MRIKMIETARGSENGVDAATYLAGEAYDVGAALAHTFIAAGLATEVKAGKAKP